MIVRQVASGGVAVRGMLRDYTQTKRRKDRGLGWVSIIRVYNEDSLFCFVCQR